MKIIKHGNGKGAKYFTEDGKNVTNAVREIRKEAIKDALRAVEFLLR